MSAAVWAKDSLGATLDPFSIRTAFGLLFFYFYGLVVGALAAVLGAFLLRRIMATLKCETPSHWAVAGGILAPGLIAILGIWGRHNEAVQRPGMRAFALLTFGPKTVIEVGWWLAIPAGAATAYLLGRVQRAFGTRQTEPQASA